MLFVYVFLKEFCLNNKCNQNVHSKYYYYLDIKTQEYLKNMLLKRFKDLKPLTKLYFKMMS